MMLENELQDAGELISAERIEDLQRVLLDLGQLETDEAITSVEKAGDGNMNCTLRVRTEKRSIVVKQSRPWVEKYPAIPAPMNRALHEIQFYETVADIPVVSSRMPSLLHADAARFLLVLEDLGAGRDGSYLYNSYSDAEFAPHIPILVEWLSTLHQQTCDLSEPEAYTNAELRELNHDHIFEIPFQHPAAVDLDAITPGLGELAKMVSEHGTLVKRCEALGEMYLESGTCLLHGDFFPGSWLFTERGLYVIDPEFCFVGRPEFDLAVCSAHLRMVGLPETAIESLLAYYETRAGQVDRRLVDAWAGVEVIRRLLGVAQLDLDRTLEQKNELIDWAIAACLRP